MPSQPAITSVAFVTANRSAMLHRALESYCDNCETYGRKVCLSVMDDSISRSVRAEYLQCLSNVDCGFEIRYTGRQEKHAYVEKLARLGIDPEIASFALLGDPEAGICTTGANRNCVLLDTIGELVLSADDDTLCRVVPHPERNARIRFGGHRNPREVWFYRTREDLASSVKWELCDLLGEHQRLLGKRLSDIAEESPQSAVPAEETCKHVIAGLRGGDARVVATMTGIAGDSGAGTAPSFLLSNQEVLDRIADSDAVFHAAFSSREVLWVARSHTVAHSPHCQGAGLGIANESLLAPFFPIGRNQDGIFGALNLITPTAFLGHVPVALLHDGAPGRSYERFPPFRIANLVLSLIWLAAPFRYNSLRKGLGFLGQTLLQAARLPEREFWGVLVAAVSRNQARMVRMLEASSRKVGNKLPDAQAEISRLCEHISRNLTDDDGCVPCEFRKQFSLALARERTRQLVREAGQLFCAWPDLVEASVTLRNRGTRLSKNITELID